ncbi:MAG: OmpA family protein [Gammaproteobacteria bacterium]|nr:OmpA family protein [Pseudomonadales bacterium]
MRPSIYTKRLFSFLLAFCALASQRSFAQDIDGIVEHELISRYPGQDIRWQQIENNMPYRVPVGPVTGYRTIDDWIDIQGRVTRTFYRFQGTERTFSEIYTNYLDALQAENFDILGEGMSVDRRGNSFGSRTWTQVLFMENPTTAPGEVNTLFAGTSSSGGAGTIVARKDRAAGMVYIVLNVEQHAADYIGTLIDIIEVAPAESGLVAVDAEAIGNDIEEYGRVMLDGLYFDFDQATLQPQSEQALSAIAEYLRQNSDKQFYVVGHTDSLGTFAYNQGLSADRARTVVDTLREDYDIPAAMLEPHGVGPLVPVFSNTSDAGRERNRRVELVEIPR